MHQRCAPQPECGIVPLAGTNILTTTHMLYAIELFFSDFELREVEAVHMGNSTSHFWVHNIVHNQ